MVNELKSFTVMTTNGMFTVTRIRAGRFVLTTQVHSTDVPQTANVLLNHAELIGLANFLKGCA